ncbi:hypothetical protein [Hyphomicrobium sp.]
MKDFLRDRLRPLIECARLRWRRALGRSIPFVGRVIAEFAAQMKQPQD